MRRQDLRKFLDDVWGCLCGSPELAAASLLRLLNLHPLWKHHEAFDAWVTDRGLAGMLLYSLDKWKLTEHGGTVDGAWLTERGEAVRAALMAEEADGFEALFAPYCAHGYDLDDQAHDCMAVPV